MRCARCHGLVLDHFELSTEGIVMVDYCVNCGWRVESVYSRYEPVRMCARRGLREEERCLR
jgi:hypothetical protein